MLGKGRLFVRNNRRRKREIQCVIVVPLNQTPLHSLFPSLSLSFAIFLISLEKSTRLGNSSFFLATNKSEEAQREREGERKEPRGEGPDRQKTLVCVCKRANQHRWWKSVCVRVEGVSHAYRKEKSSSPNDYDTSVVHLTLILDGKWSFLRLLWASRRQENSINARISSRICHASYLAEMKARTSQLMILMIIISVFALAQLRDDDDKDGHECRREKNELRALSVDTFSYQDASTSED